MTDDAARQEYESFKRLGMKLDMSRGKPAPEQLDLSKPLLGTIDQFTAADGSDARNYGLVLGLPEARALFGSLLDVPAAQVVAEGNSSLALMHDVIVYALLHGIAGHTPWKEQGRVAFLCPVPGYDRHFSICQAYGIEMIPVPMNESGPDLAKVEELVSKDAGIKGMWCVPKYSNPGGVVYGEDVVSALASLKTAAPDFILMWDDAYRLHHLTERKLSVANVIDACAKAGHPDRAIVFASTSKITFAGAGMAVLASSPANVAWWQKHVSIRTIGPDKLNQLRHVRYLKDRATVEALMDQHRALLKPKFDAVEREFAAQLSELPNVSWTHPAGGYFIDLIT
ncbi:MAG TPA: aminotransferase class I/II-fold pyridoxal phosphate-dependent enzyme, partial [Polyangiales bacterium]|nr:aminotransferase class I/II-fold pyridoxal phosphate-dependent enzyme [Polyangiales bacterium]